MNLPDLNISHVIVLRIPGVYLDRAQCHLLLADALDSDNHRIHLCHGAETKETYIYFPDLADTTRTQAASNALGTYRSISELSSSIAQSYPGASADLMEATLDLQGSAHGNAPAWHYVVETDVDPAAETDFNDWYNQEHMPGLAAVPGTIRTMRLFKREGKPQYHALYLLQTRETFGSPPWLAVRETDWSSRVRPHFRNTKRSMFRIID